MTLRSVRLLLILAAAWLLAAGPVRAQFLAPPRGLNTLTGRSLSFGYLNALRSATGTTAEKMAALNYDGVDVVLLAFATLNADGTLTMSGNALNYRSALLTNAHTRSNLFNQTDVTATAVTGAVRHTVLVGAEIGRQVTDNFRNTGYFDNLTTSITVPFATPTDDTPVTQQIPMR